MCISSIYIYIYIPEPKGRRPESEGVYIRQIPIAHVISNIYLQGAYHIKQIKKIFETHNHNCITFVRL